MLLITLVLTVVSLRYVLVVFIVKSPENDTEYSYNEFKNLCETLRKNIAGKNIARTKLKGLRNAYAISKLEAENYVRYIKAHANGEEGIAVANELEKLFNDMNEAMFFDYLDVMDVAWEGEGKWIAI